MTLSPYEGPQVRGIDGPAYKVGPRCSNPKCPRFAEHAHHIFPRSDKRLKAPYAWIEIKGVAYQNLTGVCRPCHDDLTGGVGGHKAAITIVGPDYDWTWVWTEIASDGKGNDFPYPIRPQPLTPEQLAISRASGTPESDACPTCGHVKRARPLLERSGRARKSWTIKVPADAENGAEILDTLVDDMALVIGVEPNQVGRYYVVMPCVYYAHQEKARFVESLKGVGG